MYYLLTENFKSQEAKLVELVKKAFPVEKIYLLASSLEQVRTESIFLTTAPSCRRVAHYWLLVLVDKHCGQSLTRVQDKIENSCLHFIPVTVIALYTEQFEDWLGQQHRFARKVAAFALVLYDGSNTGLARKAAAKDLLFSNFIEDNRGQQIERVDEFIAGAEFYRSRSQYNLAAFMLHQATEQVLLAILKKSTGLYLNTHNIDKLLRYCMMLDHRIGNSFPRYNPRDRALWDLLQKSYISARYKQALSIGNMDILIITERVKALLKIAAQPS